MNVLIKKIGFFLALVLISSLSIAQTAIDTYGQLGVTGNRVVDRNGNAVQLQGMSLFWSQWGGKYYTYNTVKWLRDDWCINVIRAAMAVEEGGYLTNPVAEKQKVKTIIDAAIDLGIYVIIDWHDHNAHLHQEEAVNFFSEIAEEYGDYPNIIYETFNEPLDISWSNDIKPYSIAVINAIRAHDPNNLIIVGTPRWSQHVDVASQDPISGQSNIVYSLHYYAGTHGQELRNRATTALNNNVALMVTEYGTVNADGDGNVDVSNSNAWYAFMDQHKITHCNWSVFDKVEGASALQPNASVNGNWSAANLTTSGTFVRNRYKDNCPEYSFDGSIDCNGVAGGEAYVDACQVCVGGNTGVEPCVRAPFLGQPHSVPGIIQAEHFDYGGQNVAYFDTDATNNGGDFRMTEGVDVEFAENSTTNYNIGWTEAGEWVEYTINVIAQGDYYLHFRIASNVGDGAWNLSINGNQIGNDFVAINTGDWQQFEMVSSSGTVNLQQGQQILRFNIVEGGFNIDHIEISSGPVASTEKSIDQQNKIVLYPNPSSDIITISGDIAGEWKIVDQLGIVQKTGFEKQINIQSLTSGVYFFEVNGRTTKLVKK